MCTVPEVWVSLTPGQKLLWARERCTCPRCKENRVTYVSLWLSVCHRLKFELILARSVAINNRTTIICRALADINKKTQTYEQVFCTPSSYSHRERPHSSCLNITWMHTPGTAARARSSCEGYNLSKIISVSDIICTLFVMMLFVTIHSSKSLNICYC
jgi:hypothetical protein